MRSYAESEIFSFRELILLDRAAQLVRVIGPAPFTIRCHELARAIGNFLRLDVQDGQFGYVEHSWLWTKSREHDADSGFLLPNILDVYVPGGMPQVQLVHPQAALQSVYRWGRPREDVNVDDLRWLTDRVHAMALELALSWSGGPYGPYLKA